jgi:hypothetical protein
VRLAALTSAEVRSVLAERFPRHRFPTEFGTVLHRIIHGAPPQIAQILARMLGDDMIDQEADGRWKLARPIDSIEIGR